MVRQWPLDQETCSQALDEKSFFPRSWMVMLDHGLHRSGHSWDTFQHISSRCCLLLRPQFKEDGAVDLQQSTFRTIFDQLGKQAHIPQESQVHDDRGDGIQLGYHVFHRAHRRSDLQRHCDGIGGPMGMAISQLTRRMARQKGPR